jgi:hypothetical protein
MTLTTKNNNVVSENEKEETKNTEKISNDTNNNKQSNSLDRGLEHINFKSWLFYVGVAAAIKTSILHPLTVAMARKRVLQQDASLRTVLFHPEKIHHNHHHHHHHHHHHPQHHPRCAPSISSPSSSSFFQKIRFVYRGFGIAIWANIVGEVAYFAILEYIRYALEGTSLDWVRTSAGGSAAEFTSLCLCTPCSVVCHRQMTSGFGVASDVKYGAASWTFRDVLFVSADDSNNESNKSKNKPKKIADFRRLFAGFSVALTALPAAAIWWGLYTQVKTGLYSVARKVENNNNNKNSNNDKLFQSSMSIGSTIDNPLINGASGITASVLTTILFNPFNVVRTRMQSGGGGGGEMHHEESSKISEARTSHSSSSATSSTRRPPSAFKIASVMLKHEGPRAFMKGAVVSSWSAALEGSLVSSIYEYTKWLSDHSTK